MRLVQSLPGRRSTSQQQQKLDWISVWEQHAFESWKEKRARILERFSTSKSISARANFLDEDAQSSLETGSGDSSGANSARGRLEAMEARQADTVERRQLFTQIEYIAHLEAQRQRLLKAWNAGDKVLALKIAIATAKLLSEGCTQSPAFYPSMFVLLTDILDTFGDLVFLRLYDRTVSSTPAPSTSTTQQSQQQQQTQQLPPHFLEHDVSAAAKETVRNWFYKTACIRELLPRVYIEMALLKSCRFLLKPDEIIETVNRLARQIRGCGGDPLVATYARLYLCNRVSDLFASYHSDYPLYATLVASSSSSSSAAAAIAAAASAAAMKSSASSHSSMARRPLPSDLMRCVETLFFDTLYTLAQLLFQPDPTNNPTVYSLHVNELKQSNLSANDYLALWSPAIDRLCQFLCADINAEQTQQLQPSSPISTFTLNPSSYFTSNRAMPKSVQSRLAQLCNGCRVHSNLSCVLMHLLNNLHPMLIYRHSMESVVLSLSKLILIASSLFVCVCAAFSLAFATQLNSVHLALPCTFVWVAHYPFALRSRSSSPCQRCYKS